MPNNQVVYAQIWSLGSDPGVAQLAITNISKTLDDLFKFHKWNTKISKLDLISIIYPDHHNNDKFHHKLPKLLK